jgi:methylated-DNA-[protein]-cysteine S-methyltransferase
MTEEPGYFTFTTSTGWVAIVGSARGLVSITLPQCSAQEAHRLLGESLSRASWSPARFEDIARRLKAYFSGHRVAFADELDLSSATPFQREVWRVTRLIPYAETRSYMWVAGQIGQPRAARAVGQALARNPLPIIIPCHRVVASNGKLGGFSYGLEMKKRILKLEASTSIR